MTAPQTLPPLARPSYAPGTLLRTSPLIPPPLRREPSPVVASGGVLLPAPVLDDDGDLSTLCTQLDHEPADGEVTP